MSYQKFRKFSVADYGLCDSVGKQVLSRHLQKLGYLTNSVEHTYGDIIAFDMISKKLCYHEVEIKKGWVGTWPESFLTVDIAARKKRLLDLYEPQELFFWILSGDLASMWLVPAIQLRDEFIHTKNTTRSNEEEFFCIPLHLCNFVEVIK